MADPKNKWDQPAAPPAPMFFGKKERDLVKQVNDELAERVIGQPIAYYPISIEESNFNDIYGEAIEKVALPPVRVFAYVEVANEQVNDRYGYEYRSSLTVNFNRKRLVDDQNLFVRVGDFVQYGEEFYEIVRTYNDTRYYFGQVEHKFQISADCITARAGDFKVMPAISRSVDTTVLSDGSAAPAPRAAPYPPVTATYVTVQAESKLPNERVLTAGTGITLDDGGPGNPITIASTAQSAAGSAQDIQLNAGSGEFGASSNFSFVTGSGILQVTGTVSATRMTASAMSLTPTSGALAGAGSYLGLDASNNIIVTASSGTGGSGGSGIFTTINGSQAYVTSSLAIGGTSAPDHQLAISGSVSASLNISASAFYGETLRISGTGPKLQFNETDAGAGRYQITTANGMLKWQVQNAAFDDASVKWMMNSDGQMAFRDGAAGEPIPARMYISGSGNSNLLQVSSSAAADILVVTGSGKVGIGTASPSRELTVAGDSYLSGGLVHKRTAIVTSHTASITEYILGVTGVPTSISFDATSFSDGQVVVIKDESGAASASDTITLVSSGSQTIDGSATDVTIESPYGSVLLYSNGANWFIY